MAKPVAPAPEAASARQRPSVIYVMGAGRSGSTILGVTLGNCANAFFAGELDAWLARAGDPQLHDPPRMSFWSSVREDVDGAEELFGKDAQRSIERSAALFRIHRWPARRRLRRRYRGVAESLYRAVSRAAEASLIIDSSHYPLRALELQALEGIDLFLLYLVRDPQSVVASFNRQDVAQYTKSTLTTNVYLWLTNLLSVLVFLRHPRDRRLFVRYEDFVSDPGGVVGQILNHLGGSSAPPDFASLHTGVAFQGNRLIKSEILALGQSPEAPARPSRVTTLLQLPWAPVLARLRPAATTHTRD